MKFTEAGKTFILFQALPALFILTSILCMEFGLDGIPALKTAAFLEGVVIVITAALVQLKRRTA